MSTKYNSQDSRPIRENSMVKHANVGAVIRCLTSYEIFVNKKYAAKAPNDT